MTFSLEKLKSFVWPEEDCYRWTRFLLVRGIGFIYAIAFLSLALQVLPLIGRDGLLPADSFLQHLRGRLGPVQLPTLFWWQISDGLLLGGAWLGLTLALAVLFGATNAVLLFVLWVLYMSYVNIGQTFYGFGWETMTLEASFLAIFLCPIKSIRPFSHAASTPVVIFWYRWMLFRVMFGAGLIKIRGDTCWRDLTCLAHHYETQPLPNAISWYLHQAPLWFHQGGVLFNHFVELIVPLFYFAPRRVRHAAGALTILFQFILILSGNLAWLNWLTIVIAFACFDDTFFRRAPRPATASSRLRVGGVVALSLVLGTLSWRPIVNMLSPTQMMNASFDPLRLMNTYGAFGSVGKVRREIVLEGSQDGERWQAYEFLAKPGDPTCRPPFIAPYQPRIDWQIWFAAMQTPDQNPWLLHFIYKLLQGDKQAAGLLRHNPFEEDPPQYIRCAYYEYRFTRGTHADAWWERTDLGLWLPPLTADDPHLLQVLSDHGWSY